MRIAILNSEAGETLHMKHLLIITLALFVAAANHFEAQGQTRRRGRSVARRPLKTKAAPAPAPRPAATTTDSGLTYVITHQGKGRQPNAGEIVVVHYTGTLTDGVKFDSSRDRGEPIAFKLGTGRVIKGWDEGIARLRIGDRAVLIIPPSLGYGSKGAGGGLIPPDSTLIFVVELVDAKATSLSEMLSETLRVSGIEAAVSRYRELKGRGLENVYTSESDLNGWGYRLLGEGRIREAIEVFKLNVEAYPKSANVYDSLGEAYTAHGDKQLAIESYNKALEIDPQLESARRALKTLTGN
jgi:FKBP-type peptidyl-prolyl cis-trans isomerase